MKVTNSLSTMEREIKVLIVAEDASLREHLKKQINESFRDYTVSGEAGDVLCGLKQVARNRPDLLILDVDLQGGNGFEMLDCLPPMHLPVIFMAASGDSAIPAFRYKPLDYLLKPLDPGLFLAALEKALAQLRSGGKKKAPQKLAIHSQNETEYVEIRSIVRMEASGCYTHLFLENGRKITVTKALREFESLLFDDDFTRVHNSHVINMHHIRKFVKKDGFMVRMTDNCLVPVAVRRKVVFEEKLKMVAI